MDSQQFCLKWDGFQGTVTSLFDQLRHDGELVDITLCCDGQRVRAHRMMLSACSPYFRQLIQENPCQQLVFFLKDTSASDLRAIIEFIYKGSVNVAQSQLASFIKTAETLQIRGLSGDEDKPSVPPQPAVTRSPAAKRRRLSGHDPPAAPLVPAPAPSPGSRPPESPSHSSSDPSATPSPPVSSSSLPPPLPPPAALSAPLPPPHPAPPPAPPSSAPSAVQMPPPSSSAVAAGEAMVKVEKVDTLDDDVTGLDDTLGYVAEFEGTGYQGRGSLDHMTMEQMVAGALAQTAPGPSQRIAEDGSAQGAAALQICPMCGAAYHHRRNLAEHMKRHTGQTTCCICHQEFAMTFTLRRHMVNRHGLSPDQVSRITNKRGASGVPAGAAGMAAGAGAGAAVPAGAGVVQRGVGGDEGVV